MLAPRGRARATTTPRWPQLVNTPHPAPNTGHHDPKPKTNAPTKQPTLKKRRPPATQQAGPRRAPPRPHPLLAARQRRRRRLDDRAPAAVMMMSLRVFVVACSGLLCSGDGPCASPRVFVVVWFGARSVAAKRGSGHCRPSSLAADRPWPRSHSAFVSRAQRCDGVKRRLFSRDVGLLCGPAGRPRWRAGGRLRRRRGVYGYASGSVIQAACGAD